jgi:hypothetical protein
MSKSPANSAASLPHTQSFTVRLWCEDLGEGRSEWRGQVQHVSSGETRYFRDWQMLAVCVQDMLASCVERPATTPPNGAEVEPSS